MKRVDKAWAALVLNAPPGRDAERFEVVACNDPRGEITLTITRVGH